MVRQGFTMNGKDRLTASGLESRLPRKNSRQNKTPENTPTPEKQVK
jgi:hypothetical protein